MNTICVDVPSLAEVDVLVAFQSCVVEARFGDVTVRVVVKPHGRFQWTVDDTDLMDGRFTPPSHPDPFDSYADAIAAAEVTAAKQVRQRLARVAVDAAVTA